MIGEFHWIQWIAYLAMSWLILWVPISVVFRDYKKTQRFIKTGDTSEKFSVRPFLPGKN